MDRLLTWIHPKVSVVTAATVEHVEFFGSVEAAIAEEQKLATRVPVTTTVVLNADDEKLAVIIPKVRGKLIQYAVQQPADVVVTNPNIVGTDAADVEGISAKVSVGGSTIPAVISGTIGMHSFYAVGAAFAVAMALQVKLTSVSEQIRAYQPPPGRMRLIKGIKNTLIIDDTYNSSPAAARAAIDTLHALATAGKKLAVLGDMRELGSVSEPEHLALGQYVVGKTDMLVTVGESAKHIARAAVEAGMEENQVFSFDLPEPAGRFVQERIHSGDLLLIKASQGTRCEKVVKELMAEPERAAELLTRQYRPWV
jgi:UDP-N-acetylmuramyl pentapeptide synthase